MQPLRKIANTRSPQKGPSDRVSVIVKTKMPEYVPAGVTLRARIDETMFTGETTAQRLDELDEDPELVSISRATKVRSIG